MSLIKNAIILKYNCTKPKPQRVPVINLLRFVDFLISIYCMNQSKNITAQSEILTVNGTFTK